MMRWESRMEWAVLVSTAVLCTIILVNVANMLRKVLPYRVNCWFCNGNWWVRLPERNQWTCPGCEQYNGFNKDGDYNRPLQASEVVFKTPRPVRSVAGSTANGLCHMCNINQQLKAAQLANFVPMSERNFDSEVSAYKSQLEKAYKLCTRCRKVLKAKLHREKEILLGSKLIENRSPKKDNQKETKRTRLTNFIKYFALTLTITLLILMTIDGCKFALKYNTINTTIVHLKQMVYSLVDRITVILRTKVLLAFPIIQTYEDISYPVLYDYYDEFTKWIAHFNISGYLNKSKTAQEILGGVGCFTQIVCHLLNRKIVEYQTVTDVLWALIIVASLPRSVSPLILLAIKFVSVTALFILYKNSTTSDKKSMIYATPGVSPKRMKNLVREAVDSWNKTEDSDLETDDDVSLSQYGLNNSHSSGETKTLTKQSFASGRVNSSYMNSTRSLWDVPSMNSTFDCSSPFLNSSVSQVNYALSPQTAFAKPEFSTYQKMEIHESDSDLDEGINGLHLGTSPKKLRQNGIGNIFSVKNFEAKLPRFAVPSALVQRPLISPSKLGQGTSWVAGGYWGTDGNRPLYDAAVSRSSSQSSGFESQASSVTQRNALSHPPSREESVCSELDRFSVFSDPAPSKYSLGMNGFRQSQFGQMRSPGHPSDPTPTKYNLGMNGFQQNQLGRMRSPVHPQMKYDGHIHIPLPLAPQHQYGRTQYTYNEGSTPLRPLSRAFPPSPNGSHLIKLPHISS